MSYCVIRDLEDHVVVSGYERIPNGTDNLVEARALLFGVKLAIKNKVNNLIIEGDSCIIITALIKSQTPNWQLDYIIQEAREFLSCLDSYQIMHFYREANRMVDILENRGCEQEEKNITLSSRELHEDRIAMEHLESDFDKV
ncbi:hypothetical protein SUGI_0486410 [Cryptomeria japonica]|nr:hypothetical protein SUGI_0486410 [Cryptomeria japonica]